MMQIGTLFAAVYNRFLGKITDDMYLELTPADTIKDLQNLIIDALPGFEFPRVDLYDYQISVVEIDEKELLPDDFVLGTVWGELEENPTPKVIVDRSYFSNTFVKLLSNNLSLVCSSSDLSFLVLKIYISLTILDNGDAKQAEILMTLSLIFKNSSKDILGLK